MNHLRRIVLTSYAALRRAHSLHRSAVKADDTEPAHVVSGTVIRFGAYFLPRWAFCAGTPCLLQPHRTALYYTTPHLCLQLGRNILWTSCKLPPVLPHSAWQPACTLRRADTTPRTTLQATATTHSPNMDLHYLLHFHLLLAAFVVSVSSSA